MIVCPNCESSNWKELSRSPVEPADDKFQCRTCGHTFRRYDPVKPRQLAKVFVLSDEDRNRGVFASQEAAIGAAVLEMNKHTTAWQLDIEENNITLVRFRLSGGVRVWTIEPFLVQTEA